MTIDVHRAGNALALSSQDDYWNDAQLTALRHLGVENVTRADMTVFHHVCQRTGLDPFARQIYMVRREGKQVIQTGIDGYRLVAHRTVAASGETLSIPGPEWCGPDGRWTDVWLGEEYPAAARVRVVRNGQEFVGIALWREYVQTTKDRDSGEIRVTKMWNQRSAGQLAKCAEALALRKAFPQDLSGIYVDAELDRSAVVQGSVVERGRSALAHALAPEQPDPGDTADPGEPIDGELVEDPPTSGPDPAAQSAAEAPTAPGPADAAEQSGPEPLLLNTRSALAKRMYAAINGAGITDKERLGYIGTVIGREIASSKEMTEDEARQVIDRLAADFEQPFGGEK